MIATISVKYMLMLILITIILIGLAPIVAWLSNQFRLQLCVQKQIKNINEINDVVEEVLETGLPKVKKIKIDGICAECMWYNNTPGYQNVEVKFRYAATPYSVNVSVPWNGAELTDSEANCDNAPMKSGNTYILDITPNELIVQGT